MTAIWPLVLAWGLAASAPDVAKLEHFPMADIARGQHGVCHTVFEGDTIEPFAFEVKGLMKNFLGPRKDIVLVKLLGDKPTFTGVVAGMSGSPCIIDGKLVGALSYAFANFAKEPIGGITPIDSMLEVLHLPDEVRPWRLGLAPAQAWDQALSAQTPVDVRADNSALRPIATPITLGGVPPAVQAYFDPWLRQSGFEPMAGGTHGGGTTGRVGLEAGGAVAAVLVRGDMDVAATGTVTYVDHNRVLAFGHPFFGAGAVSMPLAQATIVNTMVSAMRSFKMATTGPVVGELTQDRLTAIGGVLGPAPRMVQLNADIVTPRGHAPFQVEIARDLQFTPRMATMALASGLSGRVDNAERGVVRLKATVSVAGLAPILVHGVYAAERDGNLLPNAALDVGRTLALLWDSPFGLPQDVRVDVRADVDPTPVQDAVTAIDVDRTSVRPGQTLAVTVRLWRHGESRYTEEKFQLVVPRAWAGQSVKITAGGVDAADQVYQEAEGPPHPLRYEDIATWLRQRRSDGFLYLLAARSGPGVRVGVQTMAFLPPSAVATLATEPGHQSQEQGVTWEERRARPGTVAGVAQATVQVLTY